MTGALAGKFTRRPETVVAIKHQGDYVETATRMHEQGVMNSMAIFAAIEKPPTRLEITTPDGDLEVRPGDWIVFRGDQVAVLDDLAFAEAYEPSQVTP